MGRAEVRDWIAGRLAARTPRRIPDEACDGRAAVTLLLRPPRGVPREPRRADLLFIRRARVAGDPWSGHVAFPGGHLDPADGSLRDAARRELREETGIEIGDEEFLGRLSDVDPAGPNLPAIAVTPFVAWLKGPARIRQSREVRDHAWIPVSAFTWHRFRSVLTVQRGEAELSFPAVRYRGFTVWGLTYRIMTEFLEAIGPSPRYPE